MWCNFPWLRDAVQKDGFWNNERTTWSLTVFMCRMRILKFTLEFVVKVNLRM